ncbi:MAG TPA: 1-deoxy-D-xylulose-5-phosphate reductoisomerase [Chloroflexota bacterium]|nr:1-deoxy-D-xylulose-5-phosphate reductoisomerase [Chloroflexota bacterium]
MKRIVILGSTGSVGEQTLDVVRRFPDRLQVIGLAARRQERLAEQAAEFSIPQVVIGDGGEPSVAFPDGVVIGRGAEAMEALACHPGADLVVVATVGRAGLLATLAALRGGKRVGLANKEVLVMAGELVTGTAARHGGELIPVDSEHSALWQCLVGEDPATIRELVLTASGGALRHRPLDTLHLVTPEEALRHPTWKMGPKVTIDSATLMNKGLEVIEARWLFGVPYERIRVVMHPTSVVHSLVQFVDGSIKAQMGATDMRLPIQYALSYPERWEEPELQVDITKLGDLQFLEPNWDRYPCLSLAIEAGRRGGTYPAALCGADEVAVELFSTGAIPLTAIAPLIESVLETHKSEPEPDLAAILAADEEGRRRCVERARRL